MRRGFCIALMLVVMTSITSGCHLFGGSSPQLDRWGGPLSDLRVQWTGAPGIDLTNGVAVPIRAYIESRWLAQSQGSLDYGYTGFLDATPSNTDGPPFGANFRRPEADNQVSPFFGNETFRLVSLTEEGRNITATVCRYSYTVAKQNDDDSYSSVASSQTAEPRGIDVNRVLLEAPTDEGQSLPPQVGPEAAPSGDVFGGWVINGYQDSLFDYQPEFVTAWPTYDADLNACVNAAPDPPQRRAFLIDGEHPRSDFPTSPPSPGWPAPE